MNEDTILSIANADPSFSILVRALDEAGLTSTIANATDITLFAPNNDAFRQLAADLGFTGDASNDDAVIAGILDGLALFGDPASILADVLAYHISGKARDLATLDALPSVLTNFNGARIVIADNDIIDAEPDIANPTFARADIVAANGLVHEMDRVLLPFNLPGNGDNIQTLLSDGPDVFTGTGGEDEIVGLQGGDALNGGGGNDTIDGGAGNDALNGADGRDLVTGGSGNDVLIGGNGADTLLGGTGNDILLGDNGNDNLNAGAGNNTLVGGAGIDLFDLSELSGNNFVEDFKNGDDRIIVSRADFADFDALLEAVTVTEAENPEAPGQLETTIVGNNGVGQFVLTVAGSFTLQESDVLFVGSPAPVVPPFVEDIVSQVVASDDFDLLEQALVLTGLSDVIALSTDLTVFAPTDAAFTQLAVDLGFSGDTSDEAAVFDGIVTGLQAFGDPEALLVEVLLYHVSEGAKTAATLNNLPGIATLLPGAPLWVSDNDIIDLEPDLANPTINRADVAASDGIIQIIDRVLTPFNLPGNGDNTQTILTAEADAFTGDAGEDEIVGLQGEDTLVGLAGNDTLDGGRFNDLINGGGGRDRLVGGEGNDVVQGGDGFDTLIGGNGGDRVNGGNGDDLIIGGAGFDVINGGAGADTFDFRALQGGNVILDFTADEDTLILARSDFANFAAFVASGTRQGDDFVASTDEGTLRITLTNPAQFDNDDVIFV